MGNFYRLLRCFSGLTATNQPTPTTLDSFLNSFLNGRLSVSLSFHVCSFVVKCSLFLLMWNGMLHALNWSTLNLRISCSFNLYICTLFTMRVYHAMLGTLLTTSTGHASEINTSWFKSLPLLTSLHTKLCKQFNTTEIVAILQRDSNFWHHHHDGHTFLDISLSIVVTENTQCWEASLDGWSPVLLVIILPNKRFVIFVCK